MSSAPEFSAGSPGMRTVPSSDTDMSVVDAVDEQSIWGNPEAAPADAVFGLVAQYKKDDSPDKIDLVVGAYRTEEGKPYLLPSVSEAEKRIAAAQLDKEYLPIDGLKEFRDAAVELALGSNSSAVAENRVMSIQSLSGTGALQLVASLYHSLGPNSGVYVSNPTWANHRAIFEAAGLQVGTYRYWDAEQKSLNFSGMLTDLNSIPAGSIVVLHLCAHNPTGVDPTKAQWRDVAAVCQSKGHKVVFDSAYQGYCSGDLDDDAWAARYFAEMDMEFSITQSFSKNMGLYGERCGCLIQVCKSSHLATVLSSRVKAIARRTYSNPPKHGARIATMILTDPSLRAQWVEELKGMSKRISEMRVLLQKELLERDTEGNWSHITSQRGMFSYTGVSKDVTEFMKKERHVYLLGSGRISVAGVTSDNAAYIADAMTSGMAVC